MLMIEHRLIEKMLDVVKQEAAWDEETRKIDPLFISTAVDFVRTYADRTHHGKEEEILFKELKAKPLSAQDRAELDELIDEHRRSREQVTALAEANERYERGDDEAAKEMTAIMEWLAEFYPRHIEKEDKGFFPRTEKYFTPEEMEALLDKFNEFDRRMIHEKYKAVVDSLSER
jgi:hemerythrin-like domain-containing protein